MSGVVESLGTAALIEGAKYVASYLADAVGGHIGFGVLAKSVKESKETGYELAGAIGAWVGENLVGPFIAGGSLEFAKDLSDNASNAIKVIANNAISLVAHIAAESKESSSETDPDNKDFNYTDAAVKTAQAAAVILGCGALLASPAGVISPLLFALGNALPEIQKAMNEETIEGNNNLVNDVLTPIAVNVACAGLGVIAGNLARFKVVNDAFNNRVRDFKEIGSVIDSYLPEFMQLGNKLGEFIGTFDAGRVAMSPEVLAQAEAVGEKVGNIVEVAGKGINELAQAYCPETSSMLATAGKVALVAAAAIGAAGLLVAAPEAAAVAIGTAVISSASNFIRWLRTPADNKAENTEAKNETVTEDKQENVAAEEEQGIDEGAEDSAKARIFHSESCPSAAAVLAG